MCVLDYVETDVADRENGWLETTFLELKAQDKLSQLKGVMVAYNRGRDNSCSVKEFRVMVRESLGISQKFLEDWQLNVLIKRYAIKVLRKEDETTAESVRFSFEDQKVFYF